MHIDGRQGGVRDNHEVHLVRQGRRSPDGRAAYVQVIFRRRQVLKWLTGISFAVVDRRREPQRLDCYGMRSDRRSGVHTESRPDYAGDSADPLEKPYRIARNRVYAGREARQVLRNVESRPERPVMVRLVDDDTRRHAGRPESRPGRAAQALPRQGGVRPGV